jgi:hypothetical protein
MHTGMMWLSTDKTKSLSMKVQEGVDYYEKKYGRLPTLVLVHPSLMETDQRQIEVNKITVRGYRPVLPGHFWIGIEDKS